MQRGGFNFLPSARVRRGCGSSVGSQSSTRLAHESRIGAGNLATRPKAPVELGLAQLERDFGAGVGGMTIKANEPHKKKRRDF